MKNVSTSTTHLIAMRFEDTSPVGKVAFLPRNNQIDGCKLQLHKQQKYYSWLLVENALRIIFGKDPAKCHFAQDQLGRWTCDELHFSISHSNNVVAVAIGNALVGVDVQLADWQKLSPRLAERVLSQTDLESYANLTELDAVNFLAQKWAQKESAYKLRGANNLPTKQLEQNTLCPYNQIVTFANELYALAVSVFEPTKVVVHMPLPGKDGLLNF